MSSVIILAERRDFAALKRSVNMLSQSVIEGGSTTPASIPMPLVVCRKDGQIIWFNTLFAEQVIGNTELSVRQVRHFIPDIHLQYDKEFTASFNGKLYTVFVSPAGDDFILCFSDITDYRKTVEKLRASQPAVILITIDAIENFSASDNQNEFSALIGEVERIIRDWFERHGSVVRKVGEGRFFAVSEFSGYEKMRDDQFSVLEQIRNYRFGSFNKTLTISCGIGLGDNLRFCEKTARKALDMARGRGGDQVVINDGEKYDFFGGVVSGVASDNRVQARIVATSVKEFINHSDKIFIMGHKASDFDAVGAAIGMAEAAETLGHKARVVIDDETTMAMPLVSAYINEAGEKLRGIFISSTRAADEFDENDLLIIVDTMRKNLVDSPELLEKAQKYVVIDHHRKSVDAIEDALLFYHEPNASSACEMVTELIEYTPGVGRVSKSGAESLLAGIYLDTKSFTIRAGARTFEAAGFLKECGADTVTVRKFFDSTPREKADTAAIVASAVIKNRCAFSISRQMDKYTRITASKAADEMLGLQGVDASFVIYSQGNGSAISARSYGKINVQVIMEKLGGGGHFTMAAAQLPDTTPQEALNMIMQLIGA
ncbi:MAG: DHH family phosphoesterase [Clostridia bacterium]|nr:DHH family phosphoesterase [Clostridia bacterium]